MPPSTMNNRPVAGAQAKRLVCSAVRDKDQQQIIVKIYL